MEINKQVRFGFFGDEEVKEDSGYTKKIYTPQYKIKGSCPNINDLIDFKKYNSIIKKIQNSNVDEEQKEFLIYAATRHLKFIYKDIAEYYAHQNKEMQELMEDSALVIIDFDDAIEKGYINLDRKIEELFCEEKMIEEIKIKEDKDEQRKNN